MNNKPIRIACVEEDGRFVMNATQRTLADIVDIFINAYEECKDASKGKPYAHRLAIECGVVNALDEAFTQFFTHNKHIRVLERHEYDQN